MNKLEANKAKRTPVIFAAPFSKTKYALFNKSSSTPKAANLKQLILTQSYSNYSLLKPCHMVNYMPSSLQLKTKDQSRNSFDSSTALNSPRLHLFGRSTSKGTLSSSSRGLKKKLNSAEPIFANKNAQFNLKHTAIANKQCPSINKATLRYFKRGIKQMIIANEEMEKEAIHSNHLSAIPILTPKRKVLNVIPKGYDFEANKSAVEFFQNSFITIDRPQKKKLNRFVNSLNQNNVIEYARDFNLVKQNKFSEQYQTKNNLVNMTKIERPLLVADFIYSSNKEFNEHLDRELVKQKKKIEKKNTKVIYDKFKAVIMKAALHFSKWGIDLDDFHRRRYSKVPEFNAGDFYLTICAIKDNDLVKVTEMVVDNKFLLHDADAFGQTLLHWASKRNMFQIVSYMIEKGARVTAVDKINRTPLHIAAQMDHFESTIALLFGMADPFAKTNYELRPFDLAKDVLIQYILRRAEELYIQSKNQKPGDLRQTIRHSLKFIINVEMLLPFRVFAPYLLLEKE